LQGAQNLAKIKRVLIAGIGGSQVYAQIFNMFGNKEYWGLSYPDPTQLTRLMEILQKDPNSAENTILCLNSRSGTTNEVLSSLQFFGKMAKDKKIKSIAVTNGGTLLSVAKKLGIPTIEVKRDFSGRYSIMNELGVVPLFLLGINVKAFYAALKTAYDIYFTFNSQAEQLARTLAQLERQEHHDGGSDSPMANFQESSKEIIYLAPTGEKLLHLGTLAIQLLNESYGKSENATFFVLQHACGMPIGAHSDIQRVVDGRKNVIYMSIRCQNYSETAKLQKIMESNQPPPEILPELPSAGKFTAEEHMNVTPMALEETLAGMGIPVITIVIANDHLDEVAQVIAFFHAVTVNLCVLRNYDPFNQPGVEGYKKVSKQIYATSSQW